MRVSLDNGQAVQRLQTKIHVVGAIRRDIVKHKHVLVKVATRTRWPHELTIMGQHQTWHQYDISKLNCNGDCK